MSGRSEADLFLGAGRRTDPLALADMERAVERLIAALAGGERIAVYGDYDADGVTATALLTLTFRALGGHVLPYIPDRADEGYGLHVEALDEIAAQGVTLLVTVDCGVRSHAEVEHAAALGMDVIVTDHHSLADSLPPALAVISPARCDNEAGFDELSGVGVAYKLAQALLGQEGLRRSLSVRFDLRAEELLDLVALGTVADMVPLRGENRTLVRDGLECLNRMERPGIAALCQQARLKPGQIDAESIGFVLGPRINAAGRVDDAALALNLLLTTDAEQAAHLAQELDRLNRERRQRTAHTQERAREIALTDGEVPFLLFAADADFESGIMGLAAGRLCDEFYRPAAVVSLGDEVSRGSARSIDEFHITNALDGCSDLLIRYGGHAAAAGFTVATENLQALAEALGARAAEELAACDELRPSLVVDGELPLSDMSADLLQDLQRLEPCGCGNPAPLFLSRSVRLQGQRAVGRDGGHLKMTLHDGRVVWDAIAFRQGARAGTLPEAVDVVYHLEVNEWRGQRSLQLNVQDVRPASALDGGDAGCL